MRPAARLAAALVIGASAAFGNPAAAGGLTAGQRAEIEGMRAGPMAKLLVHAEPKDRSALSFQRPGGGDTDVSEFAGQVTVLNLWATWCPPCIHEMPALDRLSKAMEGSGVRIVTLNVERGGLEKAAEFLERNMLHNLQAYADERAAVPRAIGALGLPTTIILDPEGREIARVQGDAAWDESPAPEVLRRLAEMTGATGG